MSFPVIESITIDGVANSSSVNVAWPTTAPGDLLLLIANVDGGRVITTSSEWIDIDNVQYVNVGVATAWRVANGAETGTWLLENEVVESVDIFTIRILAKNWHGNTAPETSIGSQVSSDTVDVPALNPNGWSGEETLWIQYSAADQGATVVTAYPETENQTVATVNSNLVMCSSENSVEIHDPGDFVFDGSDQRMAGMIAVRPAAAPPVPVGPTIIRQPWTKKPPKGTKIDWTHPLSKNLVAAYIFDDVGVLRDVTDKGPPGIPSSTAPDLIITPQGPAVSMNGSTDDFVIPHTDAFVIDDNADATWMLGITPQTGGSAGEFFETQNNAIVQIRNVTGTFEWFLRDDDLTLEQCTANGAFTVGEFTQATGRIINNGTLLDFVIDGVVQTDTEDLTTNVAFTTVNDLLIATGNSGFDASTYHYLYIWKNRGLTVHETELMRANPYQIFEPETIFIPEPDEVKFLSVDVPWTRQPPIAQALSDVVNSLEPIRVWRLGGRGLLAYDSVYSSVMDTQNGTLIPSVIDTGRALNFADANMSLTGDSVQWEGLSEMTLIIEIKADAIDQDGKIFSGTTSGEGDFSTRYDAVGFESSETNCLKVNFGNSQIETEGGIQTTSRQRIVVTWKENDHLTVHVDGRKLSNEFESLAAGTIDIAGALIIGGVATRFFDGSVSLVAGFRKAATDGLAQSLSANPWQIFKPKKLHVPIAEIGHEFMPIETPSRYNAVVMTDTLSWDNNDHPDWPTGAPVTFAASGIRPASAGSIDAIISLHRGNANNHRVGLVTNAGGGIRLDTQGTALVSRTLANGYEDDKWNFYGGALDSNDDWAVWGNGLEQTGNTAYTPGTAIDSCSVGSRSGGANDSTTEGPLYYTALWNVYLSAAERAFLSRGGDPLLVRPEALVSCVTFIGTAPVDLVKHRIWTPVGAGIALVTQPLVEVFSNNTILVPKDTLAPDDELPVEQRRFLPFEQEWTKQPPAGTKLNMSHPLAQGLKYCITFNRGIPWDEVRNIRGTLNNNASIVVTDKGMALQTAGESTDSASFPKDDPWNSGWSELTLFALIKNRLDVTAGTQRPLNHIGTGDDPYGIAWIFSENTFLAIWTDVGNVSDEITDGLHPTNGAVATEWNVLGGSWNGSIITQRINKDIVGSGTAQTGVTSVGGSSNNHLHIGSTVAASGTASWDGWSLLDLIYDRNLSKAEWDSLVDNPWQIFEPQTIHAPTAEIGHEFMYVSVPWTRQPPAGAQLDLSNELAKHLTFSGVYNEQDAPRDRVSGGRSTIGGGDPTIEVRDGARAGVYDTTADRHDFAAPDVVSNDKPFTFCFKGHFSGNDTAICSVASLSGGGGGAVIYKWDNASYKDFTWGATTGSGVFRTMQMQHADGADDYNIFFIVFDGVDHTAASSYRYFAGRKEGTVGLGQALSNTNQGTTLGNRRNGDIPLDGGSLEFFHVFDTNLNEAQVNSLVDNNYQIFQPRRILVPKDTKLPDIAVVETSW